MENGIRSLTASEVDFLSKKSVWVVDFDDCMYRMDSGLHAFIKGNVITVFNEMASSPEGPELVTQVQRILQLQGKPLIQDPREMKPAELDHAFPALAQALRGLYSDQYTHIMNSLYGDRYDLIDPDQTLVDAFRVARDKGIRILGHTNGSSAKKSGEFGNAQKIMQRLGFSDEEIEGLRPHIYSLEDAAENRGGKPSDEAVQDIVRVHQFNPAQAVFFDDSIANHLPAARAGMATVWTWTTDAPMKDEHLEKAQRNGTFVVQNTGNAMHSIAEAAPSFR